MTTHTHDDSVRQYGFGTLRVDFRPVVDLPSGAVVVFDALVSHELANGPAGDLASAFVSLAMSGRRVADQVAAVTTEYIAEVTNVLTRTADTQVIVPLLRPQLVSQAAQDAVIAAVCTLPRSQRHRIVLEVAEDSLRTDDVRAGMQRIEPTGAGLAIRGLRSAVVPQPTMPRGLRFVRLDAVAADRLRRDVFEDRPARNVVQRARILGARAIADGIVDPFQRDIVRALGFDLVTGPVAGPIHSADEIVASAVA